MCGPSSGLGRATLGEPGPTGTERRARAHKLSAPRFQHPSQVTAPSLPQKERVLPVHLLTSNSGRNSQNGTLPVQ